MKMSIVEEEKLFDGREEDHKSEEDIFSENG